MSTARKKKATKKKVARKKASSPGWPAEEVSMMAVDGLVPYAMNARTHTREQVKQVAASIKEWGWTVPILVDEDGVIIAGHCRVLAAQELGIESIPGMTARGWTEAQRRAYVIADNKLAENAGWDPEVLKIEIGDLGLGDFDLGLIGFSESDLRVYLDPAHDPSENGHPERPQEIAVSVEGDLWIMGGHRLICGDCHDCDAWEKLLAGEDPGLAVTSPPYNQKIDSFQPSGMHKEGDWVGKVRRIAYQDSMDEDEYQKHQIAALEMIHEWIRDGGSLFYNHKNRYRDKRVLSPFEWLPGPFSMRQEIIWRRPGSVTQNARMFLPCDERVFWMYKGDDFEFDDATDVKTWSSVWDIAPKTNKDHPVAFPLAIPSRCIRACSMPGDVVVDPYCGSGTTIIAADKLGRRGFGIEALPQFVDVSIRRWEAESGLDAVLESTGKTFAEVSAERQTDV